MTDKSILIAVARADLLICSALRVAAVTALLGAVLLVSVIAARALAYRCCDPYRVDYDRPGLDFTSEGPDGEWGDWRE